MCVCIYIFNCQKLKPRIGEYVTKEPATLIPMMQTLPECSGWTIYASSSALQFHLSWLQMHWLQLSSLPIANRPRLSGTAWWVPSRSPAWCCLNLPALKSHSATI